MKITIDFSDDEMKKIFEDAVYKRVLDELYRDNFAEGKQWRYGIRNIIKSSIREVLREDNGVNYEIEVAE